MSRFLIFLLCCLTSCLLYASSPTDVFEKELSELKVQITCVEQEISSLPKLLAPEQRHILYAVINFLQTKVEPFLEARQKTLYLLVDSPVTQVLAYEHTIMKQWISHLNVIASSLEPEIAQFCLLSYNLTGLLKAHFETEEQVLFPLFLRLKESASHVSK